MPEIIGPLSVAGIERPRRTRGDAFEGVAFTFCKAATLVLFFQLLVGPRFVLAAVALGTAALYVLAGVNGRSSTRCLLRYPALIVSFWTLIAAAALWLLFTGRQFPSLIG